MAHDSIIKNFKYLIIAEIGQEGFILRLKNTYEEATQFFDEVLEIAYKYSIYEMRKVIDEFKNYISYRMNGNRIYFSKAKSQTTNGAFTVSVVEIDMKNFNLPIFIKERENNSIVFALEGDDGKLDKLADLFPNVDLSAN